MAGDEDEVPCLFFGKVVIVPYLDKIGDAYVGMSWRLVYDANGTLVSRVLEPTGVVLVT